MGWDKPKPARNTRTSHNLGKVRRCGQGTGASSVRGAPVAVGCLEMRGYRGWDQARGLGLGRMVEGIVVARPNGPRPCPETVPRPARGRALRGRCGGIMGP